MKSGSLTLLESSGPLQACNGTALPFYLRNELDVKEIVFRFLAGLNTFIFLQIILDVSGASKGKGTGTCI